MIGINREEPECRRLVPPEAVQGQTGGDQCRCSFYQLLWRNDRTIIQRKWCNYLPYDATLFHL